MGKLCRSWGRRAGYTEADTSFSLSNVTTSTAATSLAATSAYTVRAGDRVDVVSWRVYGDPELFWQLADGNGVMDPAELTATVGRVLRVTLPMGVPRG